MGVTQNETFIEITNSTAEAKIALHGAHVYSWKVHGEEQLFLSSASSISGPAAIRGGIPLCFPVFGAPPAKEPYSNLKSHGFARNVRWTFDKVTEGGDDWTEAQFSLSSKNPEVKKVFKPDFEVIYRVKIQGLSLINTLVVTNPSDSSLDIQALFHNYIRLPSKSLPKDVHLKELKGLQFTDKVAKGEIGIERRDTVDFLAGEVDRVYNGVPSQIHVDLGSQKSMTLKTSALPDLTVWNPHVEKSNALGDMEKDGWERFVCVEPGQTSFVTIQPHASWECSQEIIPHL